MGGPAVPGLDEPVIVARGKEQDLLARGGVDDLANVAHHQGPPCEAAEIDGLEVREQGVVALDRHHRLARRDLVALLQGADVEPGPAGAPLALGIALAGTELQDRDRLVDAAEDRLFLLEDLHQERGAVPLGLEQFLGVVEVRVGVVARAQLLHRKAEDGRVEPRALSQATHRRRRCQDSRLFSSSLPCSAPLRLSPWARRKNSASSVSSSRSASWVYCSRRRTLLRHCSTN